MVCVKSMIAEGKKVVSKEETCIFFLQGKGNKNAGFSHLCQSTSQEVIEYAAELLKPLCNHIENLHNYFQVGTQIIYL